MLEKAIIIMVILGAFCSANYMFKTLSTTRVSVHSILSK